MNVGALVASLSPRRPLLLAETETVQFSTTITITDDVIGQFLSVDDFACGSKACAPPPVGAGGSLPVGVQHVTSRETGGLIKSGGFVVGRGQMHGAMFGNGVYLSMAGDKNATSLYRSGTKKEGHEVALVKGAVRLKKPLKVSGNTKDEVFKDIVEKLGGSDGVKAAATASYERLKDGAKTALKKVLGDDAVAKVDWDGEFETDPVFDSMDSGQYAGFVAAVNPYLPHGLPSFGSLSDIATLRKVANGAATKSSWAGAISNLAADLGYDGIEITNPRFSTEVGGTQIVVFDPSTITVDSVEDFEALGVNGVMISSVTATFACDSKACAPPPIGTGGSRSSGSSPYATGSKYAGGGKGTIGAHGSRKIGAEQHERDMETLSIEGKAPKRRFIDRNYNADGTLGVPETVPAGGGTIQRTQKRDKSVATALKDRGLTREILVDNLIQSGLAAIEMPDAMHHAMWYSREHEWGMGLSREFEVDPLRVFAATSVVSAERKWGNEGTGTSGPDTNKGCIETLLKKLRDDEPFEITQEMADKFNDFNPQGTRKIGFESKIEPGMYRPSELSSVTMARLATGLGWKVVAKSGVVPIAQAIAVLRGELDPNDVVLGLKQRSFVSNLMHPEIDYTSTNDLWHYRAALGKTQFSVVDNRVDENGNRIAPKGTRVTTTIAEYESWVTDYKPNEKGVMAPFRGNRPHDILQGGPPYGGLYTETTKATREALDRLKQIDPRFKDMKIHEFQALIWKYAGGNAGGTDVTEDGSDE